MHALCACILPASLNSPLHKSPAPFDRRPAVGRRSTRPGVAPGKWLRSGGSPRTRCPGAPSMPPRRSPVADLDSRRRRIAPALPSTAGPSSTTRPGGGPLAWRTACRTSWPGLATPGNLAWMWRHGPWDSIRRTFAPVWITPHSAVLCESDYTTCLSGWLRSRILVDKSPAVQTGICRTFDLPREPEHP